MSTDNIRGSRSHVRPDKALKSRMLRRWPRRIAAALMLMAILLGNNDPVTDAPAGLDIVPTSTTQVVEVEPPTMVSIPTYAGALVPEGPFPNQVQTTLPSSTTTTTPPSTTAPTTTTAPPVPVVASIGSVEVPADPIMVFMTFIVSSPPDEDGLGDVITCHGQAELHVAIPDGRQILEYDTKAREASLAARNVHYSSAGWSLAPCSGKMFNEGGSINPEAGKLIGLHDDNGRRTPAADELLAKLAFASECVDSAEVNMADVATRMLREAFLNANPSLDPGKVTVSVEPPTASEDALRFGGNNYYTVALQTSRCELNNS